MEQSNELTRFYREYLKWIKDGTPNHPLFSTDVGLCDCVLRYSNTNLKSIAIFKELRQQLRDAKLNVSYPFNYNGNDYSEEVRKKSAHQNDLRLQWVIQHAKLWG